jgi:hypothetical protein
MDKIIPILVKIAQDGLKGKSVALNMVYEFTV